MKIYTSYFSNIPNLEKAGIVCCAICLKVPSFFEGPNLASVAPSGSILMEHKKNHDDNRYKERYISEILCAYRIFLPFVGITVSSRESAEFRNGIVKIAATKVSAGVSTGIGDHESKYSGKDSTGEEGDEQFEICDSRSLDAMYNDITDEGLQPVMNDYLYV